MSAPTPGFVISDSSRKRLEHAEFNQHEPFHVAGPLEGKPLCGARGRFTSFDPKEYVAGETYLCSKCESLGLKVLRRE